MFDLTRLVLEHWVLTLVILAIGHFTGKYLYTQHLLKKYGAQPFTNAVYDGFLGFKLGRQALAAKKEGRAIEFNDARFKEIPHPEVHTLTTRLFGSEIVFTKDPENIKAILSTQFDDFGLGLRFKFFDPLLGSGIFTLDGEGWKHSRAMLRPQFAREQIAHVRALEPHFQVLQKHIVKNQGKFFDIQELFFRFTVDSATEFLFGESVGSLRDETVGYTEVDFAGRADFASKFNRSQVYLSTRSLLQKMYWVVNNEDFRDCIKAVHEFSEHYVKKALDATPEELEKQVGYVFLYELVKQTRDPKVLRDQALNILLAGRDTTAGLLSFVFFEMAKNPEMWEKLRQEILLNFGESNIEDITFENLKKCEYLKAVLNESLRMYPSVPRNSRVANRTTTLPRGGGPDGKSPVLIRKGQNIGYVINSTHLDETYYGKDAKEFRPTRWFEPESRKLGWAFLPFNGGPRICLGQQFALTEASYVIARLAQTYSKLSLEPGTEYPPKKLVHLTMCLQDGVPIKFDNKLTLDTIIPLYSSRIDEGSNQRYSPLPTSEPIERVQVEEEVEEEEQVVSMPEIIQERSPARLRQRFSVGVQVPQDNPMMIPAPSPPPKDPPKPMMMSPGQVSNQLPEMPQPQAQPKVQFAEHETESLSSRKKQLEQDLIKQVMNRPLFRFNSDRFGPEFVGKEFIISTNLFLYSFEVIFSIIEIVLGSVLLNNDFDIPVDLYRYFIADGVMGLIIALLLIFQAITYEKRNGSFYCLATTIMKIVAFSLIVSVVFPTDRFNDISYEFVHTPKLTIEKADEKLDKKVDGTITSIHDVKEHVLEKIDNRKTNWIEKVESKLDSLDDKTDFLADKIRQKAKMVSNYKINPKLFDKVEPVDESITEEVEPEESISSIYGTEGHYINKRNQYYEVQDVIKSEPGTISIPLSLLRLEDVYFDPPRQRTYSQVINLDTQQPLKRRHEEPPDCQPITWYNIFHYSIFGEPKFCKEDPVN
ncbi:Cytochrome P450 52A11 [Spathaspora sp. JA1]|nr:Cytochrome P450 52A11 [Spathaspora sp. JA1]